MEIRCLSHDEICNQLKENTRDISQLKEDRGAFKAQVDAVDKRLQELTMTLRWGFGLLIPSLLTIIGLMIRRL